MRIRKYDFSYSRRLLMEQAAKGFMGAGVLAPFWPLMAKAENLDDIVFKTWPIENISIEENTKGKISEGDTVDASNVEHVKHLLDPITHTQISEMGRRIKIGKPTTNVELLYPHAYLEATLRNAGKAEFDAERNVREKGTGGPWIGGNPFPDPETPEEAIVNITLSWGRHNWAEYGIRDFSIDPNGRIAYQYDFVWYEQNVTSRTDRQVFRGWKDRLRHNTALFTHPTENDGTSFLSIWGYDQNSFPDLYGYVPAFRRVRQFPTDQRFEPLVPGITLFLSDAWGAGDPMWTWGNYKIIDRGPVLAPINGNLWSKNDNWEIPKHGGPQGNTFQDTTWEMVPEAILVEAEPVGYPRSPVGKRHVWIDRRNGVFCGYITYDRRGDMWKSFEASLGPRQDGDFFVPDPDNPDRPLWTWGECHIHDVQAERMTLLAHVEKIRGHEGSRWNLPDEDDAYERFLTRTAIARLGAA